MRNLPRSIPKPLFQLARSYLVGTPAVMNRTQQISNPPMMSGSSVQIVQRGNQAPWSTQGHQNITAEALTDLKTPRSACVSPSGKHVVYCVRAASKSGENVVSNLWMAEVGKYMSAEQITSGETNDEMPQWSPDGCFIAFVSDRLERGKSSVIFVMPASGAEVATQSIPNSADKISALSWSSDGKRIAFLRCDGSNAEDEPYRYHSSQRFNRLHCWTQETNELYTLFAGPKHVHDFVWSKSSTTLFLALNESSDINSPYCNGTEIVRIASNAGSTPQHIASFGGVVDNMTEFHNHIYFVAPVLPAHITSARTLWKVLVDSEHVSCRTPEIALSAVEETVSEVKGNPKTSAVLIQSGLFDQIRLLDDLSGKPLFSSHFEISTWDLGRFENGERSLVLVTSSTNSPPELYSTSGDNLVKLTNHGAEISKLHLPSGAPFYATGKDGTSLDAILIEPLEASPKPWKTVVIVHGGPFDRVNLSFSHEGLFHLGPWLASAGYAVLHPNYRGGSGRGEKFASVARGGVGTLDYDDIISMVTAGVEEGIIDQDYVIIGGWSQGGFLSYLAVTRSSFKFRAAICGAGVTDWDTLIMTSDFMALQADLAGRAPWDAQPNDLLSRRSSPIWHMSEVQTPILILHGEKDERIPLSQAIAFHRGCQHHGVECQMAVYPREPHMIAERWHVIDMLERIKAFCNKHMDR